MQALSLPPVRHVQRQASLLSGTYLPDDFSSYAWRWTCLTGGKDNKALLPMLSHLTFSLEELST